MDTVFILFTLALALSRLFQPNSAHTALFILAGQSNMAGRGGVTDGHWDGYIPPENAPDSSRIFRLNPNLTWEVAMDPLHQDIDSNKTCGVGPGMTFANTMKTWLMSEIGLIPCAIGGSTIAYWAPGQKLYNNTVERSRVARQNGEIKALLWFQGESDTNTPLQVDSYKENLEMFIQNLRSDLDLPCLPVIQVAIASGEKGDLANRTLVEQIRNIQKSIQLPNVVTVDAKGLPLNSDHVHLTTTAQVSLGHMLAEAYLENFLFQAAAAPKN